MDSLTNLMGNMGSIIGIVVAVPFLIIALVFVYLALRARGRVQAARGWSMAAGRVLASSIEPRRSHSSEGGYSTSYYPVVMYEYQVNGQQYVSNRFNFGSEVGYGFANMAQRRVDKFPPGAAIQVYYDPNDPAQSVLEQTAGASTKIYWGIAALMMIILMVSLVFTVGIGGIVGQVTRNLPK